MEKNADSYKKIYEGICYLFEEAYTDRAILESFESLQSSGEIDVSNESKIVLRQCIETLKKDYVLTVCNIYPSNSFDKQSISIRSLRAVYEYLYESGVIREKIHFGKMSQRNDTTRNLMLRFRDKYIAHLDYKRDLRKLSISRINRLLDYYKNEFIKFSVVKNIEVNHLMEKRIKYLNGKYQFATGIMLLELKKRR